MLRRSLVLALVASSALVGAASAQTPQTKIGVAAAVNQNLMERRRRRPAVWSRSATMSFIASAW